MAGTVVVVCRSRLLLPPLLLQLLPVPPSPLLLPPLPLLLQRGGCGAPMPMRQTEMLSDTLNLRSSESGRDGNKNRRPVRRTKKPCVPKGPGCLLVLV